jgi:hypothetical protein
LTSHPHLTSNFKQWKKRWSLVLYFVNSKTPNKHGEGEQTSLDREVWSGRRRRRRRRSGKRAEAGRLCCISS